MQFAQLLQLRESGVPIPDSVLLDAATIQNKTELTKAIEQQQQQQQQMQQQQQQVAMEELKARTDLAYARAEADRGLGAERYSRIEENKALATERRAEAKKDENIGFLNLIKALKELDTIDIDQLQKMMSLSQMLKTQNAVASEKNENLNPMQSVSAG